MNRHVSFDAFRKAAIACLLAIGAACCLARAADSPQWGDAWGRNLVSDEANLPDGFDPATGENVKWSAPTGQNTNGSPVVAGGRVLVGTDRPHPSDDRGQTDCGALHCYAEDDGRLLWQLVVPKLKDDLFADWHNVGIMSSPSVEAGRAYLVTNRGEVVCLDMHGLANGNDGPFTDEAAHMAPKGKPPVKLHRDDADIIWLYDMRNTLGVRQHNGANGSVLIDGRHLYVSTSNGVNSTHRSLDTPEKPSLIVLDKRTGRLVGADDARIGSQIFHGTWSSPSMGVVGGRKRIFFGGGDGVCYGFDALVAAAAAQGDMAAPGAAPRKLAPVWRFDTDPDNRTDNPHQFHNNRTEGPSTIIGMPVFVGGRVYLTAGGDAWHGKAKAWLLCLDANGAGDTTARGPLWSCPLNLHSLATPSLADALVYVTDWGRHVHCVDAATGKLVWSHKARGTIWGSTLVADGKVYFGTQRGDFWVLAAGREFKVLSTCQIPGGMGTTPTAANGVLYIAGNKRLYAVAKKAR